MSMESNSDQSGKADEQSKYKDLFYEESSHEGGKSSKPWWKSQFFVVEPVLFGTWDGVFTSCLINIFGVVLFLRTGWMVGNVGIWLAILIVVITISVALLASLSVIGVCERIKDVGTGGVYYLVSKVLGGKVGGTIGVMYAFGLCVVSALYCTGFAESVTQTFNWESEWAVRGVAIVTLILLLAINLAGVKWVIRLQLLLLLVLFISTCDFFVGTFVHTDPDAGFVGYSSEVMHNNTYISLQPGETFFTIFGVFFPTATGVMAGVNMSGDLKNPSKSIPLGTLSAITISFILYLIFVLLLGATCLRDSLQTDFMIAEKVSAVGVLWLLGVYMSSTSSCSTGLYGAPRVLQSIANENVLPILKFLGKGFGANKTPVIAIGVVGTISLVFIFIGNLNLISPVITCNFMLVYATVDYAYFALAMSYDLQIKNFSKFQTPKTARKGFVKHSGVSYGTMEQPPPGTMDEFAKDMNNLFKHSDNWDKKQQPNGEVKKESSVEKDPKKRSGKDHLKESFALGDYEPKIEEDTSEKPVEVDEEQENLESDKSEESDTLQENTTNAFDNASVSASTTTSDDAQLINDKDNPDANSESDVSLNDTEEILQQPKSCYSVFCNRWASLFGAFMSIVIMFLINWIYALANILVFLILFMYTSLSNPGLNPGASAEFSFFDWAAGVATGLCSCRKQPDVLEEYVVTPIVNTPYTVVSTVLTKDNEDFATRNRFHQSAVGDYDYASLVAARKPSPTMSEESN
ncbi:solute carrier family 12 member 8-like isoform X1 [Clavelina lepadiformis]|uniref:solute carrier family 12 member 8-like isoform X1 n=1 Tax=Clavelina lepadiformis TaxID=159417 RepID=UPI0040435870